jgi:Uma2 family endonuclease
MATDARPTPRRADEPSRVEGVTRDDLYRLSVDQVEAMIDADILTKDDPVELIDGCLIEKHPAFAPQDLVEAAYRLRVDQYEAMVERGILTEDDPVELIEGLLVRTMPKKPRHRVVKRRLIQALMPLVPAGWFIEDQEPMQLPTGQPEPDVMIVRGASDDYDERHPSAADVGLVVEIADTSLPMDRGAKLRAYAAAGVPAYWVVNLSERRVEVYSGPEGAAYRVRADHGADSGVPLSLDGAPRGAVAVGPLLA